MPSPLSKIRREDLNPCKLFHRDWKNGCCRSHQELISENKINTSGRVMNSSRSVRNSKVFNSRKLMIGLEPTTCSLRVSCSTN